MNRTENNKLTQINMKKEKSIKMIETASTNDNTISNNENRPRSEDFITYAKYKAIRNKKGQVIDLQFVFANSRMQKYVGSDPTGQSRSKFLPIQEKMCKSVHNVLDLGVARHFSYQSNIEGFDYIEGMIEPDLSNQDCVHVYTIDVEQLKQNNNEQALRNYISTLMSMFNITLMHWNAKEHYIYADTILTTNFVADNPDLYIGNTIRSSYQLYKILNGQQRIEVEKMVEHLLKGECKFLSFNIYVKNSIGENILVKVNIISEDVPDMYMIGIQY